MSVILILIGASLLVALLFLGAFVWSIKTGQYEDDYTPSVRMLFDNNTGKTKSDSNNKSNVDGTGKV
jgi:cbb3-type cytochrome oxidase maturation protein